MAKDPVCGMEVEEGKFCVRYQDKTYCFCSESCRERFEENPEKYLLDDE